MSVAVIPIYSAEDLPLGRGEFVGPKEHAGHLRLIRTRQDRAVRAFPELDPPLEA